MNDAPPLMQGEVDQVVSTVAEWNEGAVLDGAFVFSAGAAVGSVEPIPRVAGKLFLEIDEESGPYDGTWRVHPPPDQLVRTSLLAPPFVEAAAGGPPAFVYWMTGEVELEAGAQKIAIPTSPGAMAFVEVLAADGKTALIHCTNVPAGCPFSAPADGWYPLRIGWKRPAGSGSSLQLLGAIGDGAPTAIDAATRLRAPLVTAQHVGSRIEGARFMRGFLRAEAAVQLDADKPLDLAWGLGTFGLGANGTYRNSAQLRITEDATYAFAIDANADASYRLWIDGEWVSPAAAFDSVSDGVDPQEVIIERPLKAGWHDVVVEGYDTDGTTGAVTLSYGKVGQARAAPELSETRPAIGSAPLMTTKGNATPVALASNAAVSQTVTIDSLATTAPDALGVDIAVTMRPRAWTGLQLRVTPPGAAVALALPFESAGLTDNQSGTVTASLAKAAFATGTKAQGPWKVDVIHAANGQLNASNVVSEVQMHVHYAGAAGTTAAAPFVATTSTYTRMFKLDQPSELRNLYVEAIKPAGSDLKVEVQPCSDEAGGDCQAALSIEQLITTQPMTRYAKVTATFTSDGFAVPILGKLTLRYRDPSKAE